MAAVEPRVVIQTAEDQLFQVVHQRREVDRVCSPPRPPAPGRVTWPQAAAGVRGEPAWCVGIISNRAPSAPLPGSITVEDPSRTAISTAIVRTTTTANFLSRCRRRPAAE